MKTRICLITLVTALLLSSTTTFADGPFDKFLPRGRLLKKLRNDLMGQPTPEQPTPARKPDQANQKGPTPAIRNAAQQRPTNSQQRPTAAQQAEAKRPMSVRSGADGFGMAVVVDKSENLVVAQVLPNGNAAEAGIQRGDLLIEAGGVELSAIEEFQEIAKMLSPGDQVELKVSRSGRTDTVMLQHGQPPSLEDVDSNNDDAQAKATASSQSRRPAGNSRNGYEDKFSFVPPADDDSSLGMQSVIDRGVAPVRRASTQKPALSQLQSNYRTSPPQQQQTTQQQQQIQVLRQQLEQLRRQQDVTGSGVRAQ